MPKFDIIDVKKISKKSIFFYWLKGNFDFEFPIKMSFFANFQNYSREFTNVSFDRKFHTENFNSYYFLKKLISYEI